ncbi:MAG: N-acetylmuramoyl-L-alanine amidase, partial [Albidovulum sp.]|uniref:N-acetylmuramoyl-L-alanine amidase family protein n=1 Tax=Albidovulum sp. TaxID=1872424 RepID=UPI003CABE306
APLNTSRHVTGLALGTIRPGWTRIVAELDGPHRIESAEEREDEQGAARIRVRLVPVPAPVFEKLAATARPDADRWSLPEPAIVGEPKRRQTGEAPLVVVLDPGHGGIDPGAEADGVFEADVMLGFARELAGVLATAGMRPVLTREADVFVPLETRISLARAAGADVFLSLHADALAEGRATGATVYLLADAASDAASAKLAERHDRADLLAGVDLSRQDDSVARVMMDLARAETQPRSERLAKAVTDAARGAGIRLHRHPIQKAAFSVLKSPDIPSVLLEVGFLSSQKDRERLNDPEWRRRMQAAILAALQSWARDDAAEARLIRK